MYGYRHPVREHKDGAIRIIYTQDHREIVLVYDNLTNRLRPEQDKSIVEYILQGEKNVFGR